MNRLTADRLEGIWAGVTMAWDERYRFDADTYVHNTQRMIDAGVHGIYTTGSTGEFYALEFDEFCEMVDIQVGLCGAAEIPLQIGCCSDVTSKTVKLLEYVAAKPEVSAAQVNVPYWMELTDRELLQFFQDIYNACPDIPLVHYNVPRAKRFLTGRDYQRVLEVAPSLIGVKFTSAGGHFAQLQDTIRTNPQLSYFVGENLLASGMQLGVRGSYSSLVFTDPEFMLEMYRAGVEGRWDEAVARQQTVASMSAELMALLDVRGEGSIDPVVDKGLGVAAGCIQGHQRCRPPYIGWSDETVVQVRDFLRKNYPEFLHPSVC